VRGFIYTLSVLVARRYVLSGRVQGVGFRFFTEEAARVEGLSGWVSNRHDGKVEVHAEGDRAALLRFEARLRRGPAGARIDDVQVDEEPPSGRAAGFFVRE
jgi:acylphosphatase